MNDGENTLLLYVLVAITWSVSNENTINENVPGTSTTRTDVPRVTTIYGKVQGRVSLSTLNTPVQEFLGIPYAKAPISNLRFADPVLPDAWTGVKNVLNHSASCWQLPDETFGSFFGSAKWNVPGSMDEDCLYLNVWTPHPSHQKLPVIVWIYGGGFFSGSAALSIYDGKALASFCDAVVVSFNYRVGSLGFLSTGDGRIQGNFGLKDQQMALRWIQSNIAEFGGDREKVTIMGESAGAASVAYHIMSKSSSHLFTKAIMTSGAPTSNWAFMTPQQARERSKDFFEKLNCSDNVNILNCLRDKSKKPKILLENEWVTTGVFEFPWVPTIDNDVLLDYPMNILKQKLQNKIDLVLGTNENEGSQYVLYAVPSYSKENDSYQSWPQVLHSINITASDLSTANKQSMLDLYTFRKPNFNPLHNRDLVCDTVGDRMFLCPTVLFAKTNALTSRATYMFHLKQRSSKEVWPRWMGVIHGAELDYIFGLPLNLSLGYSTNDMQLSKTILRYISNFIRTGNPNRGTSNTVLPRWPKYGCNRSHLVFMPENKQEIVHDLRRMYCNFWDFDIGVVDN